MPHSSVLSLLLSAAMFWPQAQTAENPSSKVQQEKQETFTVVGITVRTTNAQEASGEGEIPKLWMRVFQEGVFEKIPHRTDSNIVVVYSNYESHEHGAFDYTLGARVSETDKVPEGMVKKTIEPGQYAVIHSEQGPPAEIVPAVWKRIWPMSEAELGGKRAYQTDFEVYSPFTDPQNMQMEVHLGLKP